MENKLYISPKFVNDKLIICFHPFTYFKINLHWRIFDLLNKSSSKYR